MISAAHAPQVFKKKGKAFASMKHSFISAGNIWVQSCSVLSSQLLWVSHSWQLSPTQLAHSPAVGGAENGRVKVWQLVGWGPEFNKVNIGHTSKAKQEFNYHSPWAGRCSAFPSPGKQDPHLWLLKTNSISLNVAPFTFFPWIFLSLSMTPYGM